jgi:rod shape-determining protein MreC
MVSAAKRSGWIALGSTLTFHVLLLALQTNHRGSPAFMRQWLLDALVPTEKLVDRAVQGVWSVWEGYIALVGAQDENQTLRAENDRLRMQVQQQDEAIREAERVRGFLNLSNPGVGKLVPARVIGRDPSRSLLTVTIDKGQSSGVKLNASVITPTGVVGRVISVARASAVVQLITDAQSEVGAMLRESRVQALFKGTGSRDLELDYIDDDGGIAVGDEVITSGLDQIHPKGLPLAIISSVGPKGELFKAVLARPLADLARLEEVLVVTEPGKPAEAPPAAPAKPNDASNPAHLPSD